MLAQHEMIATQTVIQFATPSVHYDSDVQLQQLRQRVPRYFDVHIDIYATVVCNIDKMHDASVFLDRLHHSPNLESTTVSHPNRPIDIQSYTEKSLLDWITEQSDVDMNKNQRGDTYRKPAYRKKLQSKIRDAQMRLSFNPGLLKPGAAEVLCLSQMTNKNCVQPTCLAELPVIVADGIEYFLLDQLMDLTRKSKNDRNVIHCILHPVITDVLAGGETVGYSLAPPFSSKLSNYIQDSNIEIAVWAICAAPTEVDRQRKRQEGSDLVAAECNKTIVEKKEDTGDDNEQQNELALTMFTADPRSKKVTTHDVKAEDLILQWTLLNSSHSTGHEENPSPCKGMKRKFDRSFVFNGDNSENRVLIFQQFDMSDVKH
ncbi:hypothetical protein CBR_g12298 [Chara braunii]|uniref:Uncharacterized protein n=1 Tax=Chara braunii TaxID=69332 RepID=A0A388KRN9_CHABU|nr:hypothetical protein CBR_g12298 [Chara braunii]|eukprot:GBG72731.1 hypothetical protein CBR_g12298 [Chara braunii]